MAKTKKQIEDKEYRKQYLHEYYERNKEKRQAYFKEYYRQNKDKIKSAPKKEES